MSFIKGKPKIGADCCDNNNQAESAYKVYSALITQSGTTEPTAIVLENTFDVEPTWAYFGIGEYCLLSSANEFTADKTVVFFGADKWINSSINKLHPVAFYNSTADIFISSEQDGVGLQDNLFDKTFIEVRVYK